MGTTNSIEYDANNYMDAAFAPINLAYKQAVQEETWGHLAPKRNRTYRGYIVFGITAYGDMNIIDAAFADLPDSPWLFDAMNDFVFDDWSNLPKGVIFRWEGVFRNYAFKGVCTAIYVPPESK